MVIIAQDSGPVIDDGNTADAAYRQRLVIRHLPSMMDSSKTVYKIILD